MPTPPPPYRGDSGRGRGRGRGSAPYAGRGRGNGPSGRGRGGYGCPPDRGGSRGGPRPPGRRDFNYGAVPEQNGPGQRVVSGFVETLARKTDTDLVKLLCSVVGRDLWIAAWSGDVRNSLSMEVLATLVTALARIPFSNEAPVATVPLSDFSLTIERFIKGSAQAGQEQRVRNVEACVNATKRLMKTCWNLAPADVRHSLESILGCASGALDARHKEHRLAQSKISELLDELEKPWTIKTCQTISSSESTSSSAGSALSRVDSQAYLQWRDATIAWLSTTSIFQATEVPVMKVPGTRSQGVYDSTHDYFETVLKVWVAITFEHGSYALTPHCHDHDQQGRPCGRTLWAIPEERSGSLTCMALRCTRPVVLACPNKFHNRGLCNPCATKAKEALRGPPGRYSSTHIYDACVVKVNYDGRIFADQLESRRPPAIEPNWKTTTRLCAPNLIGVVKLSGPKASLRPSDRILWGEIVVHSQQESRDEFKRRGRKQIAFTLFDLSDVSRLTRLTNIDLKHGDQIAIIDCQIFVPEFVPVLIALGHLSVSTLPFQNGALLNLSPRHSVDHAIDYNDADVDGDGAHDQQTQFVSSPIGSHHLQDEVIRANVTKLIDNSMIDPIIQLRRDPNVRDALQHKLELLVKKTTLDPGQMQSFLDALTYPVHCTLGPPGTGKSYVGVVMTRAMLIVRQLWMMTNPSVGRPPILVLSYKNHAIDEFLCDLVKSEPSVSMIRIGGGCNEPSLSRYVERSAWYDDPGVKAARSKLFDVCDLRTKYHTFAESLQALFSARADAMGLQTDVANEDEAKRRKTSTYTAASTLQQAVARTVEIINLVSGSGAELSLEDVASHERWTSITFDTIAQHFINVKHDICTMGYHAIALLYNGIKHYDDSMDSCEVLHRWLTGFEPQPPCSYDDIYRPDRHLRDAEFDDDVEDSSLAGDSKSRDVPVDNPDDGDDPDYLLHLREVFGADDVATSVPVDDEHVYEDESRDENFQAVARSEGEHEFVHPSKWNWDSSFDERWAIIEAFIFVAWTLHDRVSSIVTRAIDQARMSLLEAEVRAKAHVYEGKAVLGGTIVSCIGRLEAIRALNPFAVIVEEASEVLEPLLLSCISTSTCKFEQIGDHLQLSPSLMSKFEYERINKINVSMFERFVRAPRENRVPYTVLSIQRRMRKNIADLTREFYDRITAIEDHEICSTKLIGQSAGVRSTRQIPLIDRVTYKGREVPGIAPSIFFWQHTGSQTRADVGLSKVNDLEADMVCRLAKYLVDCGVPKTSIAVITPYKGQLMLIRKQLQEARLLAGRRLDSITQDTCVVSTVDRFQGDEADVVLVSLVADEKSKSPFVKLQNRMIVLLSRARLGLFIVGNTGYFNAKGAEHWKRALDILKAPGDSDNANKAIIVYDGPRMGTELPLCCPLHRSSMFMARNPDELSLGFCDLLCDTVLRCTHMCGLRCHWPRLDHNAQCSVPIASPCPHHRKALICTRVFAVAKLFRKTPQPLDTIDDAMALYRCQEPVDVEMPCSHSIRVTCAEEHDYSTGALNWPVCSQPALRPYVYACGHDINLTCSVFTNWERTPSLVTHCKAQVLYRPQCGHEKKVACYLKDQYECGGAVLTCNEMVQLNLPRCGHSASVPCKRAAALDSWTGNTLGATVIQPCHLGTQPTCATLSLWECEAGHRFKYPQCSEGVPEHCPSCIQHHLAEDIRLLEDGERPPVDPDVLTADLDESKLTSLRCLPRNEDDVRYNRLHMLLNFRDWQLMSMDDAWLRPVYRPAVTKWFIPVNDSGKDFRLTHHVKSSTLHGVQVYPWTRPNIECVLLSRKQSGPRSDLHFVIGVAFTCHVLVDPPDIPKGPAPRSKGSNKQKLKAQQQAKDMLVQSKQWVQQHRKNGFDAVQRHLKDGSTTLVLWDPFALSATHAICASHDTISAVASSLPEDVDLGPVYIQAKAPSQQQRTTAVSSTNVDFRERHREHLDMLLATRLSGLQFETRLIGKLQFTKSYATESPPSTGGPFGGLEYLKTLSASMKVPELQLFRCLELLHLDFATDAEHEFQEYLHSVDSRRAHPLTIVAAARLAKNSNPAESRACLMAFVKCYEDCAKDWLTPDELACLEQSTGVGDVLPDVTTQSAKSLWEQLKESERCHSDAMEELLALTGLKKVKTEAVLIFKSALVRNKMDAEKRRKNAMTLNFCFLGNPGTGKTTVARLFAQILKDCGMRRSETFIELTAQKLKDDGVDEFRKAIKSCGNGTIFVDEAYDLDPFGDFKGKPIVAELLNCSENMRDCISFILAGYEDDIQNKLFAYNDGLKSRFQEIVFEDFDEDELKTIWQSQLSGKEWNADPAIGKLVAYELSKAANRKGFGNARAVRKLIETATNRRMSCDDFDTSHMELRIEDVVGEDPLNNPKVKRILGEFNGMTGWTSVKQSVVEFVSVCSKNYQLRLQCKPSCPVILNRLFLGNPGTGKTTCAHLYADLLKELNFLSVGGVVFKTASDFVGSVVGESQKKANNIIENARGKVLVIDEAYNLADGLYGNQVLDVIVEKVQGTESDDIAVLLLGYEKNMSEMIRKANPGLARRFAFDYAFRFEDYDDSQLLTIFNSKCHKQDINVTFDVSKKAIRVLSMQRSQANFGNAGAVDNLLKAAVAKASLRPGTDGIVLQPDDIDGVSIDDSLDPLKLLDGLYKVDEIRAELVAIRNAIQVAQVEGSPLPPIGHFVFRGNPGTGKTTVARAMSKILFQLGILPTDRTKETSGLGLTGEYVGHTKKAVEQQLGEARGGVLFIDEAYDLGNGSFGLEAITTLVAAMTDEQYQGMVIILAGYAADMDRMLDRNSGLKSRITHVFDFDDWDADDCALFFSNKASKEGLSIPDAAIDIVKAGCEQLITFPGWANGRDVTTLWEKAMKQQASRVVNAPEHELILQLDDVERAVSKMIAQRRPPDAAPMLRDLPSLDPDAAMASDGPHCATEHEFARAENVNGRPDPEGTDAPETAEGRDPGVSDADWAALEEAKRLHEGKIRRKVEEAEEARRLHEQRMEEIRREQDEARRRHLELVERERREKELAARQEEERKAREVQEKLRRLMSCPAGFNWYKCGSGWRCGGGSHFVSDAQLNSQFTC
ncbi:unnamed protein product (mitochondrion) [Plasmodiophora brassicae]|uniref:AAA+ ATPase domain-containing protein n=1 Tax=Plasmodiophora brassicae TaxID=37360 RepID=A0A3P3YN50_PLABS|nr:unnamed protein product [Plasmodiophora brassicae]